MSKCLIILSQHSFLPFPRKITVSSFFLPVSTTRISLPHKLLCKMTHEERNHIVPILKRGNQWRAKAKTQMTSTRVWLGKNLDCLHSSIVVGSDMVLFSRCKGHVSHPVCFPNSISLTCPQSFPPTRPSFIIITLLAHYNHHQL